MLRTICTTNRITSGLVTKYSPARKKCNPIVREKFVQFEGYGGEGERVEGEDEGRAGAQRGERHSVYFNPTKSPP